MARSNKRQYIEQLAKKAEAVKTLNTKTPLSRPLNEQNTHAVNIKGKNKTTTLRKTSEKGRSDISLNYINGSQRPNKKKLEI